jgi:hypothetical protein
MSVYVPHISGQEMAIRPLVPSLCRQMFSRKPKASAPALAFGSRLNEKIKQ